MSDAASRADEAPTESPPLQVWIGFVAMVIGQFLAVLDIQIVASSIGSIQAGISASRDEISWVQTAYLIAEVVAIPLTGFLTGALGTRLLFSVSAVAFSLASLLCAFAWDINSLIIFRALQGFCGAAMIPSVMATLYVIFPRRLQPMAAAITGMMTTLAPSMGPTIGGYISEMLGWRALFWINLVPGLLIAVVIWNTLRSLDKPNFALLKRIDFWGLVGLAFFLGGAEYTLEEGPANDWFASSEIVVWALASVLGAALFFWRAVNAEVPIVDLRPFKTPAFAIAGGVSFVLGMSLFSAVYLTPLFLSSVRGYSALDIGHTMFVQGVVMFVAAPFIGSAVRFAPDIRPFGFLGFLLVGWSCWEQAHLTAQSAFWQFASPQVSRGLGLMLAFTVAMQASLQSLPAHLVHTGAALFNTMRNMGGAFGIAALTTVQRHSFALHRQELYAAADPTNPHVAGMIAGSQSYLEQAGALDPERQALMRYAGLLDREALVMTFNDQFLTLTVIVVASAFAVWLLRAPPRSMSPQEAPAMAH